MANDFAVTIARIVSRCDNEQEARTAALESFADCGFDRLTDRSWVAYVCDCLLVLADAEPRYR